MAAAICLLAVPTLTRAPRSGGWGARDRARSGGRSAVRHGGPRPVGDETRASSGNRAQEDMHRTLESAAKRLVKKGASHKTRRQMRKPQGCSFVRGHQLAATSPHRTAALWLNPMRRRDSGFMQSKTSAPVVRDQSPRDLPSHADTADLARPVVVITHRPFKSHRHTSSRSAGICRTSFATSGISTPATSG